MPAAYTLLAFGLAAAATGLLLRNVMAAVAVAGVVQVVVLIALTFAVREGYLPPETVITPLRSSGQSQPADSQQVRFEYLDADGREMDDQDLTVGDCNDSDYIDCLRTVGFVSQLVSYQPASRYWPFQAIESGIALTLLAGTLGAGLWGLRRRVH